MYMIQVCRLLLLCTQVAKFLSEMEIYIWLLQDPLCYSLKNPLLRLHFCFLQSYMIDWQNGKNKSWSWTIFVFTKYADGFLNHTSNKSIKSSVKCYLYSSWPLRLTRSMTYINSYRICTHFQRHSIDKLCMYVVAF